MRSLLLTVASLALVMMPYGTAAAPTGAAADFQRLQHKMTELTKSAAFPSSAAASTHAMDQQQQQQQLSTLDTDCQQKIGAALVGYGTCPLMSALPPNQVYATDAIAEQQWAEFALKPCYTQAIIPASSTSTADKRCFEQAVSSGLISPALIEIAVTLRVLTEERGSDNRRCAVSFNAAQRMLRCESRDRSTCSSAPDCRTVPTDRIIGPETNSSRAGLLKANTMSCEPNPTSFLGVVCTDCLTKLGKALVRAFPARSSDFAQQSTFDRVFCSKTKDDEFCQIVVDNNNAKYKDYPPSTQAGLDSICKNSKVLGCMAKSLGAALPGLKIEAAKKLRECEASIYSYRRACLRDFERDTREIKENELLLQSACTKNGNGEYCLNQRYKLYAESNGCLNKALTGQACATCNTTLQTAVADMGCCAGTLQKASAILQVTREDLPKELRNKYASLYPLKAEVMASERVGVPSNSTQSGFIDTFASCGVSGLNDTLRERCTVTKYKVKKAMKLKIRYSSLKANATLMEEVKAGLRADVAAAAGVTEENIVNDVIVEDSSVIVSAGSTRRQQANSNSGIRYEFEIETEDEAMSTSTGENFDAAETDGVVLMQTNVAVADCTDNCADADLSTSANEAQSGASEASVLSGAAMMAAGLVLFCL